MASNLLYHVTPTSNLESILASGITPRAGKWYGPQRVANADVRQAVDLIGRAGRAEPWRVGGDGFMIWKGFRLDHARQMVRLGVSLRVPGVYADEWPPQVFLATSLMAAYEVAYEFSLDRHHDGKRLSILSIHRSMAPKKPVSDAYLHIGSGVKGIRLRRKRLGSLMTDTAIPACAIASHRDVPDDLLGMADFRRWMGLKTDETYKAHG